MSDQITVNLKVTNKNEFTISDRFDGVPFEFEPNKPLVIPGDAALHMLGWQPDCDMRMVELHVQRRWGWNTAEMVKDGTARKYFLNIELRPVTYRMVEVQEEGDDINDLPADAKNKGNKGSRVQPTA